MFALYQHVLCLGTPWASGARLLWSCSSSPHPSHYLSTPVPLHSATDGWQSLILSRTTKPGWSSAAFISGMGGQPRKTLFQLSCLERWVRSHLATEEGDQRRREGGRGLHRSSPGASPTPSA